MVNRYSAQILLPEIGVSGQEVLARKKVLCIGAGGLASSVLPYLVASGVGSIFILDYDVVSLSNLNRQILFNENDLGKSKSEIVAQRLSIQNPQIKISYSNERFNFANGLLLISEYDLLIDCCDDYATKLAINYCCGQTNTPWVFASVLGWDGQVALFSMTDANSPCYKCFQHKTPTNLTSCTLSGVSGPAVNVVGSFQASLALQALLGNYHNADKLTVFDLWLLEAQSFTIKRHLECRYHHNDLSEIPGIYYHELKSRLTKAYLIDVRSNEDWDNGHYVEAIHLPIGSLLALARQQFSWDDELVLYCNRQMLSQLSASHLRELGYRQVYVLKDGYTLMALS